eukprot:TRINITY_DN7503_c0_g1_i1.p1 TRINITY_DN7503_c0_g1~~TRINITY_DN7503_c0_g1_i1.p1  ORF type:complete len:213 (-),score=44.90 TRINITY_DN7503_c0_g1_i1:57-695(-)
MSSLVFFLMIRRPPRSTLSSSSAASDVYKRQVSTQSTGGKPDRDGRARVKDMARVRDPDRSKDLWAISAAKWRNAKNRSLSLSPPDQSARLAPTLDTGSTMESESEVEQRLERAWLPQIDMGSRAGRVVLCLAAELWDQCCYPSRKLTPAGAAILATRLCAACGDPEWAGGQVGVPVQDLSLIHISEPTRLLSISYAVFCLKKKKKQNRQSK